MAGGTQSWSFDPFIQVANVQVSQEAAVFVWTCSTDSEGLSKRLARNEEWHLLWISANDSTENVFDVRDEMDDLLPRLNDYNVSEE